MRPGEEPSKYQQWLENQDAPVATRTMNKQEIEEHRNNLVASYKCANNDITYKFQKILNEDDEDRDDCIWLKYYLKCIIDGIPTDREIFKIKLPIPEELRKMANQIRKQTGQKSNISPSPKSKKTPPRKK